jgi:hypothetical protein
MQHPVLPCALMQRGCARTAARPACSRPLYAFLVAAAQLASSRVSRRTSEEHGRARHLAERRRGGVAASALQRGFYRRFHDPLHLLELAGGVHEHDAAHLVAHRMSYSHLSASSGCLRHTPSDSHPRLDHPAGKCCGHEQLHTQGKDAVHAMARKQQPATHVTAPATESTDVHVKDHCQSSVLCRVLTRSGWLAAVAMAAYPPKLLPTSTAGSPTTC